MRGPRPSWGQPSGSWGTTGLARLRRLPEGRSGARLSPGEGGGLGPADTTGVCCLLLGFSAVSPLRASVLVKQSLPALVGKTHLLQSIRRLTSCRPGLEASRVGMSEPSEMATRTSALGCGSQLPRLCAMLVCRAHARGKSGSRKPSPRGSCGASLGPGSSAGPGLRRAERQRVQAAPTWAVICGLAWCFRWTCSDRASRTGTRSSRLSLSTASRAERRRL